MPITLEEAQIYDPYEVYMRQVITDSFKYNQLHSKLNTLSDNLLDFVFSPEPAEFIKDKISMPFNLDENQSKEIAKIVMEIIVADSYLGNIIEQIRQRAFVDEQKAKTIAGLVVAELFTPILDELKKKHVEKFSQMAMKQNPAPPSGDDSVIDLRKEFKI